MQVNDTIAVCPCCGQPLPQKNRVIELPVYDRTLLEQRLLAGRDIDPVTGCWNWRACGEANEYGKLRVRDKRLKVHRISAILYLGFDPASELYILHRCDNRRCCNPAHLFVGTSADNARDRESKGRGRDVRGERNGRAKITQADVAEIRKRRAQGETLAALAAAYGVTDSMVGFIASGKNWKE